MRLDGIICHFRINAMFFNLHYSFFVTFFYVISMIFFLVLLSEAKKLSIVLLKPNMCTEDCAHHYMPV